MKLPKRFSLSALLVLMLVVASIFGYAQWRRQWIIAEVKSLSEYSVTTKVNLDSNDDDMISLPTLRVSDGVLPEVTAIRGTRLHDQVFWHSFEPGRIPVCYEKTANGKYRLSNDVEEFGLDEFKTRLSDLQSRLSYLGFSTFHYWQYEYKDHATYRDVHTDIESIGDEK